MGSIKCPHFDEIPKFDGTDESIQKDLNICQNCEFWSYISGVGECQLQMQTDLQIKEEEK